MRIFRKYHVGLIVRHNLSKLIILAVPCLFIVVPLASTRLTGLGIMMSPEALLSLVFGCVFLMVLFGEMKFDIKRFAPRDRVRVLSVDRTTQCSAAVSEHRSVALAVRYIDYAFGKSSLFRFKIFNEYGECVCIVGSDSH